MPEHTQTKTCTIPGCDRAYRARGWCATHWARWKAHGTTADPKRIPTRTKCSVDECDRKPRSRGAEYCEMHYYRLRRNGSLETVKPRVPEIACVVDGCKRPAERTDGLCRACLYRLQRNGTFDYVGYRTPDHLATYTIVHQRIRSTYGPAAKRKCVDCGRQARQWSYNHRDPNERWGPSDSYPVPMPYSVDLAHYEPRCVPCHKRMDLAWIAGRKR